MKSSITQLLKYELVEKIKSNIFPTTANTYVCIGRPIRWGNDATETSDEIEDISSSINYQNQLYRDMVALKKVEPADISLVVPRIDWASAVKYDAYADHIELFTHSKTFTIGAANTVSGCNIVDIVNDGLLAGNLSVGNTITLGTETKEVIAIGSGVFTCNSTFSTTYINNNVIRVDNTYPRFANTFYVRNSKDQVFKCLYNANVASTIEPTIDIDGQLPENPYIEPGDGYKWKYLYTIPYGLKQKFFTKNWMPVVSDPAVVAGATGGRLDIINITNGGSGYYLDGQSGNSNSLSIITITGDGTDASVTARVSSGVITGLNILNGGSGYTTANVIVSDPDQLASGTNAVFDTVISPPGGHGSDPAKELGCYSVMVSVTLSGTENGKIPVSSTAGNFDFRQIALIRDPKLANGVYANGTAYSTTTKISTSSPGITNYINDEILTDNLSASANNPFSATVINWDPSGLQLAVNNINGNTSVGNQITGTTSGAVTTILGITSPDISLFTGDLLYIENRLKIIRNTDQSEQIRLTLSF